jgi:hypothetical protein
LTTHEIVDAGTAPTFVPAAASDTAEIGNGHNTFVVYKNASASNTKTITVTAPGNTDYGQPNPDPVINVPVTSEVWIPLRKDYDPGDGTGRATLTVGGTGGVTDVTVAVVRMS